MSLPVYILHLERAAARRENVARLRQALGPEVRVIAAIDGRAAGQGEQPRPLEPPFPAYPFALRRTEVAAFQSHRACLRALLDDGHAAALIVEDDVALGAAFPAALAVARAHLRDGMLVRFPELARERGAVVALGAGGVRLIRPRVIGLGMLAQLVTRGAAERLLRASERFDRPVDTFLQLRWLHGVDVLAVQPSGVSEISAGLGGSSIHMAMPLQERLRREALRPLYRLALAVRSRAAGP